MGTSAVCQPGPCEAIRFQTEPRQPVFRSSCIRRHGRTTAFRLPRRVVHDKKRVLAVSKLVGSNPEAPPPGGLGILVPAAMKGRNSSEPTSPALVAKAAMFEAMGYSVNLCGDVNVG